MPTNGLRLRRGFDFSAAIALDDDPDKMLAFDLVEMAHRPLCAWGKDAADQLLLGAVPADVGARFGRLVVGSGDHALRCLDQFQIHIKAAIVDDLIEVVSLQLWHG